LGRLLKRRRLFVSPFSLAWEEPARENLAAELSHLRARLAELGGSEPAAEPVRPAGGQPTSWARRGPAVPARPTSPVDGTARPAPPVPERRVPGPPVPERPVPERPVPERPVPERPVDADAEQELSGIERDPDFELRPRPRKRRRDRAAAQGSSEAEESPGSLFRPPPRLPRS